LIKFSKEFSEGLNFLSIIRALRKFKISEEKSKNAGVAQLVERNLAKVEVESSSLFSRSKFEDKKKRKREASASLFCQHL
jgi:hypothetical protein